jgi:hypothetical protein
MPIVPLGIGSYKASDLPEVKLRNFYLEKDLSGLSPDKTLRIGRPGLTRIRSYPIAIRAAHYRTATGEQLVVAGGTLYSSAVAKGSIGGSGIVPITSTPFASILLGGTALYLFSNSVAGLALPNDAPAPAQDVDQLNGYGIVLCRNGRFYWLVPGETAIDPVNFATAESLPDRGVAVRRLGDEFLILGTENGEFWQPTGDVDAPFQRASGRNIERGCLYRDTARRFDNSIVWVGDDYQVYRVSSVPQVISDPGIAQRIRKATGECSAWTFGIDGHSFYVLRIPGQGSFAYDAATQQWSEFASLGQRTWNPHVGYQVNGEIIAGSSIDGRLWRVNADAKDDDGEMIERAVTATIAINGKPPRNDSVSIGVGASADCTIRLRWKDGQDDYPDYYEELNVRAPFDVAQMWRLGRPDQPYRTLEVSCVDQERIRIAGMVVNEGWA